MDKENCKLETKMPAANSVPERPIRYLRPIGDKVLVRLKERESRIGSIIIPDSAQKENCWGEIVALGTGVDSDACRLNLHDIVFISPAQGTYLVSGQKDLILIEAGRIMAKLLPDED